MPAFPPALQTKRPPSKAAFSVPGSGLALAELLAAARLVEADLLSLDFARIARDESRLGQRGLQLRVVVDERARDAVAHRTGLARLTAADHVDHDVERALVVGQHERL